MSWLAQLIHVSWSWTIHFQDGLCSPRLVPWCSLESLSPSTQQHVLGPLQETCSSHIKELSGKSGFSI